MDFNSLSNKPYSQTSPNTPATALPTVKTTLSSTTYSPTSLSSEEDSFTSTTSSRPNNKVRTKSKSRCRGSKLKRKQKQIQAALKQLVSLNKPQPAPVTAAADSKALPKADASSVSATPTNLNSDSISDDSTTWQTKQPDVIPKEASSVCRNTNVKKPDAQFKTQKIEAANGVEAAINTPTLSTLTSLLSQTGLVPALQNAEKNGPITVFAPSNEAFDNLFKKVGPDIAGKLADPKNKDILSSILTYHVSASALKFPQSGPIHTGVVDSLNAHDGYKVVGPAASPSVINPSSTAVNGDDQISGGPTLQAKNGTIIIPINEVLIPPDFDPSKLQ